jgi:hypothetical protein
MADRLVVKWVASMVEQLVLLKEWKMAGRKGNWTVEMKVIWLVYQKVAQKVVVMAEQRAEQKGPWKAYCLDMMKGCLMVLAKAG